MHFASKDPGVASANDAASQICILWRILEKRTHTELHRQAKDLVTRLLYGLGRILANAMWKQVENCQVVLDRNQQGWVLAHRLRDKFLMAKKKQHVKLRGLVKVTRHRLYKLLCAPKWCVMCYFCHIWCIDSCLVCSHAYSLWAFFKLSSNVREKK